MSDDTNPKKFLTYPEAAAFLSIRLPTLYTKVSRHEVPFVRLSGRMIRFDVDALRQWLRERSFMPVAPKSNTPDDETADNAHHALTGE